MMRNKSENTKELAEEALLLLCKKIMIGYADIISARRHADLVDRRQVIAVCLRKLGYSYPVIGSAMNRDHTSIIHLCKRELPEYAAVKYAHILEPPEQTSESPSS